MKKRRILSFVLAAVMVLSILVITPMPELKAASDMSVKYRVHIQDYGDSQGWVNNGKTAGTFGQSKRLEEIKIELVGNKYSGNIVYKTHCQDYGWLPWTSNGAANGSRGEGKRLEAIQIYLTGEIANHYDVTYRVHAQDYGWLPWVRNGEMSGTSGESKRLEGIEIKLTPKEKTTKMGVQYRTHCQDHGWLAWSSNGKGNGTTGESKRLEGIEINLTGSKYSGGIEYRTHIQDIGWEKSFKTSGEMSGTSGQSKRLEAIEIKLYGQVAQYYDVYYRVHAQDYGWLGWVKNGAQSGTSGGSKRLESIEIMLVDKGVVPAGFGNSGAGFINASGSTTAGSTAGGSTAGGSSNPVDNRRQEVTDICNENRAANGVKNNLKLDDRLTEVANIRAKELATSFSHIRPDGTSPFTVLDEIGVIYMTAGENIANRWGMSSTANEAMEGWLNSPGHRANILTSDFNKIGVGIYTEGSTTYWVQLFTD